WRRDANGRPRPGFPLDDPRAGGASILVAGSNFGCGSSREHAPWALFDAGFRAVVSSSIADIFRANAAKNGLVPVVVPADLHEAMLSAPFSFATVDLESMTVALENGKTGSFSLDRFARHCLMNGLDELGLPLEQQPPIGAVGGPKWAPSAPVRPEQGLLALRKELGLFANLRPVTVHPRVAVASPIKAELLADVDFVVVRELTGGIYFGEKTRTPSSASDLCSYTAAEVRRVVRVAARLAQKRRRRLTSVDKANVLETSRLWREVTSQTVQAEFPDLQLEHVLVDSCAMLLVHRPSRSEVVVTETMFGDILTDEAAVLAGSIGLLPSASLGEGEKGVYEPI